MPFGQVISFAFFVILLVAAITSSISLLEVGVAYFVEELKMSRKIATLITFAVIGIFGVLCSLSLGELKEITIFGKNMLISDYTLQINAACRRIAECFSFGMEANP